MQALRRYIVRPVDNPCSTVKNSLKRGRNTEQRHILMMNSYRFSGCGYMCSYLKLFGITVSNDLKQFHDLSWITHRYPYGFMGLYEN